MKIYTGEEFKLLNQNKIFYKITSGVEIEHGVHLNTGINKITKPLSSVPNTDGLYFVNLEQLSQEIFKVVHKKEPRFLRVVEIIDTSIVCVDSSGKYKTNTFNLGEKMSIYNSDVWKNLEFCKLMMKISNSNMNYIRCNLVDIMFDVTLDDRYITRDIINQFKTKSLEDKLKLIDHYPKQFNVLDDYSEEICDKAIDKLDLNIMYVFSQTEKQSWKVLHKNSTNIAFIKNPTESMIIYSIMAQPTNIKFIKDEHKTPEVLKIIDYLNISSKITKREFKQIVQTYLDECENTKGEENKKFIALKIYNFLSSHVDITTTYDKKFAKVVKDKLEEFRLEKNFTNSLIDYYITALKLDQLDESKDDPINDPINDPTNDPINDPTNDPKDESEDDPTNDPEDEPTDEPKDELTDNDIIISLLNYLNEIDSTHENEKRKKIFLKMFDFLSLHVEFLTKYKKFAKVVKNKLEEFKLAKKLADSLIDYYITTLKLDQLD